jgi:thiosulfate/3-mercaptopyruvate sulfurtransferase
MTFGPALETPVVSTQWLADYLGADNLVVLDASVLPFAQPDGSTAYVTGHEAFLLHGHVPGARFADVIEELSDPEGTYPFTRPSAARFASAVGGLGIDNDTTVVVYDSLVGQWAARVWWLFRAFGYDRVAVLDGGFTKWLAEERPTEIGHVPSPRVTFTATERPELWVDKTFVEGVRSGEHDAALLCASPAKEFSGETTPRPRAGHIPGSLSVPAATLVDHSTNALVDDRVLREKFAPALGSPRIVLYCGAGIAAAAAALALVNLGERAVAIYDGSLNEWTADPDAALEVA